LIASAAQGTGLTNYNIVYVANTLTVDKATLTVTADNKNRVYGDDNPELTYTIAGFKNSEDATIAGLTGTAVVSTLATAASNVNTYDITSAPNDLLAANYDFAYVDGSLVVNKRPINLTVTAGQTKVYGDSDPDLFTFAVEALGTGRGLIANDQTDPDNPMSAFTGNLVRATGANVANYAIGLGTVANDNYDITLLADNFAITKRPVIITAGLNQHKTYGDADPARFTFTVEALGTSRGLIANDQTDQDDPMSAFTGNLQRAIGENAGSYAINQGTVANPNYEIAYVSKDFVINKAQLTATGTMVYDGQIEFSGASLVLTGVTIGNVTETLNASGTVTMATKNVQVNQAPLSNASLTIQNKTVGGRTFLASNYEDLAEADTSLTVTRKLVTLTAPVLTKTYDGGYNYNMTAADLNNMSAQTELNGDLKLVGGDRVSAATVAFADKDAGVNKVVNLSAVTIDDGNGGLNYNVSRENTSNSTINKADLTVRAVNAAKFVDRDDPGFNVIYNGFKNGETAPAVGVPGTSDLSAVVTVSRTTSGESAGTYAAALMPGGATSNNYNIQYVAGDFVIAPAESLLVQIAPSSIVYGAAPSYTITAKYLASDNTETNLTPLDNGLITINDNSNGSAVFAISAVNATYSSSGKINVGGYNLAASNPVITGNNFRSLVVVGSLTVNAKELNVGQLGITGVDKVYDGGNNISGLVLNVNATQSTVRSGDSVAIYGTGTFQDRHVGTNKNIDVNVSLSGADARNYSLSTTRVLGNFGSISQLASVTWVGPSTDGRWSNATNWANGAKPDGNNVAQVIIPTGFDVLYDSALVGQIGSQILNSGAITFNGGDNFNFNSVVSGAGNINQTGAGTLTVSANNTNFGGNININASSLVLANANALGTGKVVSNGGSLATSANLVLPRLTVDGPVNLASNIKTDGAQTYNGAVTITATRTLESVNSDVIFNGTVDAGLNSYAAQKLLEVIALNGLVKFNGNVGNIIGTDPINRMEIEERTVNGVVEEFYIWRDADYDVYKLTSKNIFRLDVTAANIAINADVTTFENQIYTGAIRIGNNGNNGFTRTLVSLDPKIEFNGTIDDSGESTHTLVAKAIANANQGLTPVINFMGDVGSFKALAALTAVVGNQQNGGDWAMPGPDPVARVGTVSLQADIKALNNVEITANRLNVGVAPSVDVEIQSTNGDIILNLGAVANNGSGINGSGTNELTLTVGTGNEVAGAENATGVTPKLVVVAPPAVARPSKPVAPTKPPVVTSSNGNGSGNGAIGYDNISGGSGFGFDHGGISNMLSQQEIQLAETRLDRAVVDVGVPQVTATDKACDTANTDDCQAK
jgi:hypothetical protein